MNKDRINMTLLSLGRIVSDLGTWTFRFALSLYILDITGSSAKFSLIFGITVLPTVLVNIFAGVLSDKFDRKKIIVLSDLISGIAVAFLSFIFVEGEANILLFSSYAFLICLLQSFFQVSMNASVPNLVSEKNIVGTNSLIQGIGAIVNVLGPLIGALLYSKYGLFTVMIIDAVSFILSGISEMFIKFKNTERSNEQQGVIPIFKNALRFLNEFEGLKSALLMMSIFNFFLSPIVIMGVTYVSYEALGLSKEQAGLIQSSFFIGNIIGAILLNAFNMTEKVLGKIIYIVPLSSIPILIWYLVGINPVILESTTITILLLSSSIASLGILIMMVNIPMFTVFQIKIPDEMRASIFGIVTTVTTAVAPLGIWICGVVLEFVDWVYVFLAVSILISFSSLFFVRNKKFLQLIKIQIKTD